MQTLRLLLALAVVLVVTACTSAKPGWTYAPAPSATPIPSVEASGSAAPPSGSAPASAPASAGASAPAGGTVLEIEAQGVAFNTAELTAPADQPFQIHFTNNDASIQHNVAIHEGSATGTEVFKGEIFVGPGERTYDVPALKAGAYAFACTVHPNMTGTLTVQ
ncbi:MAG TPA: cupredoxin domain-containing protein [Candidatus Limnocylindrales bacterium]|jgi:plastocyanin|nr:cupredoxin domain-containing protein [Candidatus Limnocylindrales bacterium]